MTTNQAADYADRFLADNAVYFQRIASDYARDAVYYSEHGITKAARHAQQNAEVYAQAAQKYLRALLA